MARAKPVSSKLLRDTSLYLLLWPVSYKSYRSSVISTFIPVLFAKIDSNYHNYNNYDNSSKYHSVFERYLDLVYALRRYRVLEYA